MVSMCNQERGRDADEERGTKDRTSCHPWTTGILLKGLQRLRTAESPSAPQGHLCPWLLICMADLQREDGPCHLTVLLKMKTNKSNKLPHSWTLFSILCPTSVHLHHQTAIRTAPENEHGLDAILKEDIIFWHALPLFFVLRWSGELLRHRACLSLLAFIGWHPPISLPLHGVAGSTFNHPHRISAHQVSPTCRTSSYSIPTEDSLITNNIHGESPEGCADWSFPWAFWNGSRAQLHLFAGSAFIWSLQSATCGIPTVCTDGY